jgi:mono/diheme cytochrome c family protein
VIIAGAMAWYLSTLGTQKAGPVTDIPAGALAAVVVPASFTEQEQTGARAYDAVCASCHGVNAQGQDGIAPPLVHKIYEPSHHGDMAFVLAAQNGVRAHHWKFGNMPAVEGVTQGDVLNIVAYIRAVQRANGIE